jgi:hypothetical protein
MHGNERKRAANEKRNLFLLIENSSSDLRAERKRQPKAIERERSAAAAAAAAK